MNLNAVSRKNGTETAAAAQKQKGNEAAQAKAHAEGGAEGKAAASDARAEAAVAVQEQKEAETAKKKTQAEGWTNEEKKTQSSDDEIKRLIKERRTIAREDKQQLKEVSKRIKECIRNKTKAKRIEAMKQILEKFSGIKNISQIKSARKKTLILKTKNEKGETVTSRKGSANVFGEFHSKLHDEEKDVNGEYDHCRDEKNKRWRRQENEDKINEILEFSKNEVQAAIDCLEKKGKASDCNGVRAEDIEACSEKT